MAAEETQPITPEEHRKLWQGVVLTPAGTAFEVRRCDLIEFLLLFVTEEEVEEIITLNTEKRIEQIKKLRAEGKEDEVMKRVCLQNVVKPQIVEGEAGPGQLSYDELHPLERRYIMTYALSLPRFFRANSRK
jgi:hypothetical protein